MDQILSWNRDKPHRCPNCHTVAVDTHRPTWWAVYACCNCGVRFTRWPRLAFLLLDVGVQCSEHGDA